MRFTEEDIPKLAGKRAVVTGATGGLGYETARALASAGAVVVLAGRDDRKGALAVERMRRSVPGVSAAFANLDLASLLSVRTFRKRIGNLPIDILVNNAGVMSPPSRSLTADGFELQFGTNHLGHFALTSTLLPLLTKAGAPRVVSISSGIAAFGRIAFDDIQSERSYGPNAAYAQSKLANLLFARELQSLSDRRGWNILSATAHPGHARTDLIVNGAGRPSGVKALLIGILQAVASHDAASGALPGLLAATGRAVQPLDHYGPTGLLNQKGPPGRLSLPSRALDDAVAKRLWDVSEALTGDRFQD